MVDQNMMPSPEKMPAVTEEFERLIEEEAGRKAQEGGPKATDSNPDAHALRKKIKGQLPATKDTKTPTLSGEEAVKQKMESIIDRSLQQAIAAGFGEAKLEKILKDLGKKYPSHPHILKEVHARILEERDQRLSGKID